MMGLRNFFFGLLFLFVILEVVFAVRTFSRATIFLAPLFPHSGVKSSNLGLSFAKLSPVLFNGNVSSNSNTYNFQYGVAYNGDTITSVKIMNKGTTLQTSNSFTQYSYVVQGSTTLSSSEFQELLIGEVTVTVYTKRYPNGAVTGAYALTFGLSFGFLSGAQVAPTSTDSTAKGFSLKYYTDTQKNFTGDITQKLPLLFAHLFENVYVLHNVSQPTAITVNGPARPGHTAGVLGTLPTRTSYTSGAFLLPLIPNLDRGLEYVTINSRTFPDGEIRSQLFESIEPIRQQGIESVRVIAGSVDGSIASTNRKTGFPHDRNGNATLRLVPDPIAHFFEAVFTFQLPVLPSESWRIRGLILELELLGDGDTWVFEYFNFTSQNWTFIGLFSNPPSAFAAGGSILLDTLVPNVLSPTNQILIRVSNLIKIVSGRFLTVARFTVTPFLPSERTATFVSSILKKLSQQSG